MSVREKLTAIADAIRSARGAASTEKYSIDEMPEKISEAVDSAFDGGWFDGHRQGINEGIDAGKKSQYDEFWDNFQENGNRTNYTDAFRAGGWNSKTLKPKYDMQPTTADGMFYFLGWHEGDSYGSFDLKAHLESIGTKLDFSQSTSMNYCFQNSKITRLGVIDVSNAGTLTGTFMNMYWGSSIEKIIVSENNTFSYLFNHCYASHIVFEGTIANSLSIPQADLDNESLESIIDCLKNIKETGTTLTLTLSASSKSKLTDAQKGVITQKGWTLA